MGDSSEDTSVKTKRPKEQGGLLSSVEEIKEFDKEFWEVTKGLPIRSGSLLKVPSSSYHRFGIKLTPENRPDLISASERFYRRDIEENLEREMLHQTEETEETKQKREVERKMSWVIGDSVRETMHSLDDGTRKFRIVEIGMREISSAIAGELYMHQETRALLDRVEFHLVDWSPTALLEARTMLHRLYGLDAQNHDFLDFGDFLLKSADREFDFIVSVGSFHHKSTPDFLLEIKRCLKDDGILLSGEWYSALWHHPYTLYKLLEVMGTDERRLSMFASLFGELLSPSPGWVARQEEVKAISEHTDYWLKIQSELNAMGSSGRPRLYMLKANLTSREYSENLRSAGFETDLEKIKTAFPKATISDLPRSMLKGSDFAVVTAAIKRR